MPTRYSGAATLQVERRDVVRHRREQHDQRGEKRRAQVPARMVEARMKVTRYSASGSTHRKGTLDDVLRDVVGDGEQHHRAHRREREPQQLIFCRNRLCGCRCRILFCRVKAVHRHPRRAGAEQRERGEQERPAPAELAAGRTRGSNSTGKPSSASSEAKLESANRRYGTALLEAAPVPRLQQRRGRRKQEVRQADGRDRGAAGCARSAPPRPAASSRSRR